MAAEHTYKFNVTMTCGGCSGAVERVLKKMDGEPVSHPFFLLPLTTMSLQASSPSTSPSTRKRRMW